MVSLAVCTAYHTHMCMCMHHTHTPHRHTLTHIHTLTHTFIHTYTVKHTPQYVFLRDEGLDQGFRFLVVSSDWS